MIRTKNVVITSQSQGIQLRNISIDPEPERLVKYLHKDHPNARYESSYKTGFSGSWVDRKLRAAGIKNIIVNPVDIPIKQKEKRKKTDKIDSRKLARELNAGSLECIYIPSEESESIRALCRIRKQITKDQKRLKCKIKSPLHFLGIPLPENSELRRQSG